MTLFRREKWWHREIERVRRDAAAREAELIQTICVLAGKPVGPVPDSPEPDAGDDTVDLVAAEYAYLDD